MAKFQIICRSCDIYMTYKDQSVGLYWESYAIATKKCHRFAWIFVELDEMKEKRWKYNIKAKLWHCNWGFAKELVDNKHNWCIFKVCFSFYEILIIRRFIYSFFYIKSFRRHFYWKHGDIFLFCYCVWIPTSFSKWKWVQGIKKINLI